MQKALLIVQEGAILASQPFTGMAVGPSELVGGCAQTWSAVARDRRVSDNDIERLIAFYGTDLAKAQARDVPLSSAATALINELPEKTEKLFGLDARSLDTLFRRVRDRTEIENLRFHDSRNEAITRLA